MPHENTRTNWDPSHREWAVVTDQGLELARFARRDEADHWATVQSIRFRPNSARGLERLLPSDEEK